MSCPPVFTNRFCKLVSDQVPTFDEMMWPTLLALKPNERLCLKSGVAHLRNEAHGNSGRVQNLLHGDGPKSEIEYRMLWTRTYLHKVGAIQNGELGVWSITAAGNALTEDDTHAASEGRCPVSRNRPGHRDQPDLRLSRVPYLRQLGNSLGLRGFIAWISGDLSTAGAPADQALQLALREGNPTILASRHLLQMIVRYHALRVRN
jgi:hypothetical protein